MVRHLCDTNLKAAAVLGDLPARSRAALSHMADFFNTPVEPSPPQQ